MKEISKEELYDYYITQNKSTRQCGEYFECSHKTISNLLKKFNIIKNKPPKAREKISKQWLYEYYIVENHTTEECGQYWGVSRTVIERLLKQHDIRKDTVSDMASKEWLIEHYINQNWNTVKCAEFFNCCRTFIEKLLKKYDIKKTSTQRTECREQTCLKKYSIKNPAQSEDIKEKMKSTCMEKYGVEYVTQSDQMKNNTKKSCMEKYGVEYVAQSPEFKKRAQEFFLENYGVKNIKQKNIQHYDIWSDDDNFCEYLKNQNSPTINDLCIFFNLERTVVAEKVHKLKMDSCVCFFPNTSKYEQIIVDWLSQELLIKDIEQNNRTILDGQEIDIYLPDYNFGIEFNGDYWHCDLWEKFQDHGGRSTYHQNKSLLAESKGIFLFHIFEHEWNNPTIQENIKNRLRVILNKNTNSIGARKCLVIELTKEQKNEFLNQNHLQGADRSKYAYGLMYENELVACMTFNYSKYAKYNYELTRFCSKHGINVCGGASKLFKYFLNTVVKTGENVVSYNDITKTEGKIYQTLGFVCSSINSPNYIWMNFQTNDIRTRYQEQAAGEVERMHLQNYHRICDCGTKTWIYTKEED